MEVRRARADEWRELRDTRLAALADAPEAFGSTLEREEALPEERWRDWVPAGARGEEQVVVAAVEGGRWVGMAGGYGSEEEPGVSVVIAMWVHPSYRRHGVGRELLEAVEVWARERGARTLRLGLADGNPEAAGLYAAAGFRPVARMPLRPGSAIMRTEMERPVEPSDA
ncbi:MAG: GNAT family N-acetyltransferase [Actinobacteria bacterium]|nr:GNAT family N-acetyltransferase [Actinomycetota bacterium]